MADISRTPIPHLPPELAANQQYEIQRELGRGGMGVVYLAKNKPMDRLEVLKVVNTSLLDRPGAVERFLREIRSAAKLSHANVVTAYSVLQQGGLLAFAMEYIEGQDLASVVKSQGPLPAPYACYYVQQAALGLQHAHEKKMVHRDIKPQNLILTRKGKKHLVKVLDFGLAKVMREKSEDTGLTGEGKMLGTPDYIAPEQSLDAAKADIRADIYSLGCTLYYLLSGTPPFSGASVAAVLLAHQMQEARPLNLVRPEVPEELAALVRKMMARSPAKRYQTPLQVVQALARFLKPASGAASAPRVPPAPELPSGAVESKRSSPKRWLIGGGVAVGVLLLALLGMWAAGVFRVNAKDSEKVTREDGDEKTILIDPDPFIAVRFHDGPKEVKLPPGKKDPMPEASMRFGLVMLREKDPLHPERLKKLTFDEWGRSNNTVLKVDGRQFLFGEPNPSNPVFGFDTADPPGEWLQMKEQLKGETTGRPRDGLASSWFLPGRKIQVTQEVEIVPGTQSRRLDTCLVRYILDNRDTKPHQVGIRFLLDTTIGATDGVPFAIPGVSELCDTKMSFDTPNRLPDFIQALEKDDLREPGTVAYLQFRLGKSVESPSRVMLGGWPNPDLQQRGFQSARAQLTGWDVPFSSIKERLRVVDPQTGAEKIDSANDSAVTLYWSEQALQPSKTRVVGFSYGLGSVATHESGGHLLLTVGGRLVRNDDFTLVALVHNPQAGEKLTLQLPPVFSIREGNAEQTVPAEPPGVRRPNRPVTWRLRVSKAGRYELSVSSSTGVKQQLPLTIRARGVFD